jgi:type IV pilus assembly protein PilA
MRKNFDEIQNENKGFSLVELIVAIAIMAVLVAVLAPALLQYVERSRAQKDDSAMGEVTNAILLAMSDQNVYDEMLYYTYNDNYSCYTDGGSNVASHKFTAGTNGQAKYVSFNDEARVADETVFQANGTMRGVTITFCPTKNGGAKSTFILAQGHVNAMGFEYTAGKEINKTLATTTVPGSRANSAIYTDTYGTDIQIKTAKDPSSSYTYMYNQLRSVIGDTVDLKSQTYRNSCYTVFIKMGTTGGKQASAQDAIQVYGQWNGTNLMNDGNGQNTKASQSRTIS